MDAVQVYIKDIKNRPKPSQEEVARLAKLAQEGDREAMDLLVRSMLPYVVSCAAKLAKARGLAAHKLPDLIQMGNIGLMYAITRFDPDKARLSTYATHWIYQRMREGLATTDALIRLPTYLYDKGREKKSEELEQQIKQCQSASLMSDGVEECWATYKNVREPDSRNDGNYDPGASAFTKSEWIAFYNAMDDLPERERKIIQRRMQGLTLVEIGDEMNITRERVRQIETRAMRMIRRALGLA